MKRQPDLVPKVFDDPEFVRGYVKRHARLSQKMASIYADVLSQAGFESGRILDAGTGPGDVAIHLARLFPAAHVLGLDLGEPALELARAAAQGAALSERVTFEQGDVESMPFEDDSFDAVISLNTFHVVDDPVAMLNEIERVLKPDGVLAVNFTRRWWLGWVIAVLRTGYTMPEAQEIVARSNLRPVEFSQGLWWLAFGASPPAAPWQG
jgi:ubiquinone/menaquinone biosynthesis C-methylase UbiE